MEMKNKEKSVIKKKGEAIGSVGKRRRINSRKLLRNKGRRRIRENNEKQKNKREKNMRRRREIRKIRKMMK